MNFRFVPPLAVSVFCLFSLLFAGCTAAPPNPAGFVQVWVEPAGVRLLRNGETVSFIKPRFRNVERWKFAMKGTAIVIKSRERTNQPAAIELFDVETGALKEQLMTFSLYSGPPAWARGLED